VCLLFIAITGKYSITSEKNNPSPFLAERVPHFLSLQKKVRPLFVIGAPFLSIVGPGELSFPCRKTWDFPSHLKQVFLLLSEQVCLLFLNETGVLSISCKVGVPLRYQNKGPFSSLLEKQFFFFSRGLLFAKLTFPTCSSGPIVSQVQITFGRLPTPVTRFTPPGLVSTPKLRKYLPTKRVRNKTSLPRRPSFAQGNLSLRIMLEED